MKLKHRQRGISGWGILMLLVIGGFGAVTGFKLMPIYMESYKIDNAVKGVLEDSGVGSQSKTDIKRALLKRLDIDGVRSVGFDNFKETVTINKEGGQVSIEVYYDRETPLFGNLTLIAHFEKFLEAGG